MLQLLVAKTLITASGKTNIRRLQLESTIMNERDIDFELLEFLTSPPSVQRMTPEEWQQAWEYVCIENKWLVMQEDQSDQESGECPYCIFCSKWAEVPHLLSDKCRQKRQSQGYAQDGPLLAAILKAEQSTGILPQHPKPKMPGPLAPEQISLKASFGHAPGVPKRRLRFACRQP